MYRIPKANGQLIGQFCRRLTILYGSTEMNAVSAYISSDPSTFEDGLIGTPNPGNYNGSLFNSEIIRTKLAKKILFEQYVNVQSRVPMSLTDKSYYYIFSVVLPYS